MDEAVVVSALSTPHSLQSSLHTEPCPLGPSHLSVKGKGQRERTARNDSEK